MENSICNNNISVEQVKKFWEEHPLLGYELKWEPGTEEFFNEYDRIREKEEFKYCFGLLNLSDKLKGRMVLDVGCGNGWILSKFSEYGAQIHGIDLTQRAIGITQKRFKMTGIKGLLSNASAEEIPFKDNTFDIVTSLGVIHHTPGTEQCGRELIRVCKPGGRVLIAVYYENLLIRKWSYPFTRFLLSVLGRKDLSGMSRQEFINRYDGPDNPLGKVYSKKQACGLLDGLERVKCEAHYFPSRLVPALKNIKTGGWLDRYLDSTFGFLIYVEGIKPCVES